jgi:YggT family protein
MSIESSNFSKTWKICTGVQMVYFLIQAINLVTNLLFLLILAYVILSYVVSPYNQIRMWVDRIVEPMLRPIRRVVPLVGMLDFSPIVLLILVQIVGYILKRILIVFV